MNRRTFMQAAAVAGLGLLLSNHEVLTDQTVEPEKAIPNPFEPYGRIVYQTRPEAPNQIYVVGQMHADPLTKKVYPETVSIQIEIFHIGQRLASNLDLVLLEGTTADENHTIHNENARLFREEFQRRNALELLISDELLPKFLQTEPSGIPQEQAGFWLAVTYGLDIQGAEDKKLHQLQMEYLRIKRRVRKLAFLGEEVYDITYLSDTGFENLTQLRSAYILLNTPTVIEREYAAGRIKRKNALVVIGADHIVDCIQFVKEDHVKSVLPDPKAPPLDQPLGYTAAGYGVTIIMPRTVEQVTEKINEQLDK